jgi:hypothetical protein
MVDLYFVFRMQTEHICGNGNEHSSDFQCGNNIRILVDLILGGFTLAALRNLGRSHQTMPKICKGFIMAAVRILRGFAIYKLS